ncbi:hypothetical protein [Mycolicibacterium gilvum]|uniref:hypothetical protein n=1 Tax=Mycolicibacterium gilvum TaxID=1804 RepID=UPI0015584419|nr:hypothetical protein [Mycolicibacterium gilvum]MCV7055193.1 hypothetical protein [Mycolicibacterium gilvum]
MDFVDSGVSRNPVMQRLYQSIATVSSAFTHVNVLGIANCRHREWQPTAAVGCQIACHLSARRPGTTVALPLKCRPGFAI